MERNTQTQVKDLQIGDRFYKCTDKRKNVLQMVLSQPKATDYRTYIYWAKKDTDKHPQALDGNTYVIFLRHTEPEPAPIPAK